MYNNGYAGASHPILTHVTFEHNTAHSLGGGMSNFGSGLNSQSNPTLTHVTFNGNSADSGGGMYNDGIGGGQSNPTLTHVTFSGNTANDDGGGMVNDGTWGGESNPTLINVLFSGNQAVNNGGGMYNWSTGSSGTSSPALTNVTFSGNAAGYGGGMYNNSSDSGTSNPTLRNVILWGNTATHGPQIYNHNATPTVSYSNIQWPSGTYTGTGNINANPQFVAPIAATHAPTTTGNYRLAFDSPAIDAGDPDTCPARDLDNHLRDDLRCDMGAYERVYSDGPTVVKSGFDGGTPYSFGPTWVSMTLSLTDTGALTVTKHLACPGGTCNPGELPATWHITSALSDGLPLTVSFCYTDAEVAGLDEASLQAFRWDTDALTWTLPISTGLTVAEGCVTLTGIEAFSAWTLKDVSIGAATPTAVRVVALAARGFAPVAALLALGGAAALRRRRRR